MSLSIISNNLNYDDINIEARANGEDIIIIPIKDNAKDYLNSNAKYLKISETSILNLMIVRSKAGKLRWSFIVSFHPSVDKRQAKLSVGTLQNLLNNKPIEDDGVYKFVNLNGKLSYQFEYKEGKISSVGTTVTKTQLLKLKENITKRESKPYAKKTSHPVLKNAPLPEDCEDFYLVTTYYDGEGGTYEDWEYLYTECDGESGGGGGGGGGEVEEDPDIELQTDEEFTSYYEDAHEADMVSSPNSIAPMGTAGPVGVRFQAEVWRRYNRVNSRITAIYPGQPAIFYGQVSSLYYNDFLQKNVIRKATLYGVLFWEDYMGVAATVTWRFNIIYKYHQSPYIAEVYTRYTDHEHVQAVSAWDIGSVSWDW